MRIIYTFPSLSFDDLSLSLMAACVIVSAVAYVISRTPPGVEKAITTK